ncbi:POX family protein [Corchorus capsularis]|uniref:POX family protein n=1 Tax=Corchorus capsularis TaxID=210143 RepID=A0A1R3IAF2_COCAP|nr:POX family protein [Corchorus capsularis]
MQNHLVNQIQAGFESNPEIFNLTTGMEMIGFSKGETNAAIWKGFFNKPSEAAPSSSKTINESTTEFYPHEFNKTEFTTTGMSETSTENLIVGTVSSSAWQENHHRLLVDDSSLRCVFPCEGNERPSQGLSLSLSSSNPSSIGLQSFELRQTSHMQQQMNIQDGFLGKSANLHHHHHQGQFSSKYLGPAQELLNEFCSLGTKQIDAAKQKQTQKNKQWDDENNGASSSKKQSLYSLDFMELQKRKTKLLSMLEEVDRRYRHYCDQMKAVVSSFEAVAGTGAASVYSALASKAMSRHFRCLRDGIVSNWFINARVRLWKPMVEDMYMEEVKENENNMASSDGVTDGEDNNNNGRQNQNPLIMDQKPTPDQLVRVDSECLSSIITNPDKNHHDHAKSGKTLQTQHLHQQQQSFGNYGAMELDFSSYSHHHTAGGGVSYGADHHHQHHHNANQSFNGGGVSLTLGLQQHAGSGVSLAFSPASQSSLFYPRDHIEDCQPVQYSLLDGEGQHLPYRNLMGAQLLHDLAG